MLFAVSAQRPETPLREVRLRGMRFFSKPQACLLPPNPESVAVELAPTRALVEFASSTPTEVLCFGASTVPEHTAPKDTWRFVSSITRRFSLNASQAGCMYSLDFAAQVDLGLVRETNQDVARVEPALGLAVVADGMRGHERGEVASSVAVGEMLTVFQRLGGLDAQAEETARRLLRAFEAANVSVRAQPSSSSCSRMGTTLVAAALGRRQVVIAHVGDSRCYLVRRGTAECLTQDHSYAAELRRQGLDSSPELCAAAEQHQNILTRCIGGADEITVDATILCIEPGDVLVLCSDGLWGGVGENAIGNIVQTASSAEEACRSLISAAWQAGGLDNIGVAVVRVLRLAPCNELPPGSAKRPASP